MEHDPLQADSCIYQMMKSVPLVLHHFNGWFDLKTSKIEQIQTEIGRAKSSITERDTTTGSARECGTFHTSIDGSNNLSIRLPARVSVDA